MDEFELALDILEAYRQNLVLKLRIDAMDNMLSDINPGLHVRYIQDFNQSLEEDADLKRLKEKIKLLSDSREG
jgi:hypothetical protein